MTPTQHEKMKTKDFECISQPDINLRIVLLFLEKLEVMTAAERGTIKKTIDILNHPIFISGQEKIL